MFAIWKANIIDKLAHIFEKVKIELFTEEQTGVYCIFRGYLHHNKA